MGAQEHKPENPPNASWGDQTLTAPTWLRDHLIRTGRMTETGLSRRARIRPCPTCPLLILTGLDAEMCATEAACDPSPLSPLGEALALVEGRRTWALHSEAGRWVLDPRDSDQIASEPAGSRLRQDVLRAHRCESGAPTNQLIAPTTFPETSPPLPPNSPPPF